MADNCLSGRAANDPLQTFVNDCNLPDAAAFREPLLRKIKKRHSDGYIVSFAACNGVIEHTGGGDELVP